MNNSNFKDSVHDVIINSLMNNIIDNNIDSKFIINELLKDLLKLNNLNNRINETIPLSLLLGFIDDVQEQYQLWSKKDHTKLILSIEKFIEVNGSV